MLLLLLVLLLHGSKCSLLQSKCLRVHWKWHEQLIRGQRLRAETMIQKSEPLMELFDAMLLETELLFHLFEMRSECIRHALRENRDMDVDLRLLLSARSERFASCFIKREKQLHALAKRLQTTVERQLLGSGLGYFNDCVTHGYLSLLRDGDMSFEFWR